MKLSIIVPLTVILIFTVSFLLDIWSTLKALALGCIELNPFFAPFTNSPSLLFQAYFVSWFAVVGIAGFVAIMFRKHWYIGFSWYWLVLYLSFTHFQAGYHNLLIAGLC